MINIDENFEVDLWFKMDTMINIAAYTRVSQHYSEEEKCWVHEEPSYFRCNIYNIHRFHDVTEEELHKSVCTNVKFPTKICTMIFYDKDNSSFNARNGVGWMFVVGTAKENNRKLEKLKEKHDKMIKEYYKDISKLREKYENIMNADK